MEKLIRKESVLEAAKGFTFTDKVEEKMYMDFLRYCLDNVEILDSNKKVSSSREKLLKYVESFPGFSSDLDIIKMYLTTLSASSLSILISELQNMLDYKINELEFVSRVAKEKALYLKTYLKGDMYTTKEAAIKHIPVQIENAQKIIDVCNGKYDTHIL